jgi:hypothetical protein
MYYVYTLIFIDISLLDIRPVFCLGFFVLSGWPTGANKGPSGGIHYKKGRWFELLHLKRETLGCVCLLPPNLTRSSDVRTSSSYPIKEKRARAGCFFEIQNSRSSGTNDDDSRPSQLKN